MSFFHRYRSPRMSAVLRGSEEGAGVLLAREIEVEIDFRANALDERGMIVPERALARLENVLRGLFDGTLLIDNSDPYADDLMKLKRIKAAEPVLFDHGTSGPQLSFYIARWTEDWLTREDWNPKDQNDPRHVEVVLATVRIGRSEFFYDLA